jgi:hypothetical protein
LYPGKKHEQVKRWTPGGGKEMQVFFWRDKKRRILIVNFLNYTYYPRKKHRILAILLITDLHIIAYLDWNSWPPGAIFDGLLPCPRPVIEAADYNRYLSL